MDFGDDEGVEVEIRNHRGEVVQSYIASKTEAKAIPKLMEARQLLVNGDPMGAFGALVDVCHSTNTNVFHVIDQAKETYKVEQEMQEQLEVDRNESFLSEQGNENILQAAYRDGSSTLCSHCHALIQKDRFRIHTENWCPALHPYDSDEE